MAKLYVKLSSRGFHTSTFLCISLVKLMFWLLVGEKKELKFYLGRENLQHFPGWAEGPKWEMLVRFLTTAKRYHTYGQEPQGHG